MSVDETTPNRATVAGLDAKLDGLKDLMRAEFAATQRQLDTVAALPAAVASLRSDLAALDRREREADEDMSRRVDALEQGNARWANWRAIGAISFISALIGAGATHLPHL